MLEEDLSAEADQDALHGIEAGGFAQWSHLDHTLDTIAAALGHRHL